MSGFEEGLLGVQMFCPQAMRDTYIKAVHAQNMFNRGSCILNYPTWKSITLCYEKVLHKYWSKKYGTHQLLLSATCILFDTTQRMHDLQTSQHRPSDTNEPETGL